MRLSVEGCSRWIYPLFFNIHVHSGALSGKDASLGSRLLSDALIHIYTRMRLIEQPPVMDMSSFFHPLGSLWGGLPVKSGGMSRQFLPPGQAVANRVLFNRQ